MLSVLLGLGMSMHLMAYQATQQQLTQTLVANDYGPIVSVQWEYKSA
jgi:hypothetical protein